jgi:hypothetical protein
MKTRLTDPVSRARWRVGALGLWLAAGGAWAGGLQTRFVNVRIRDVPVGYATGVRLDNGARYTVGNTGGDPVTVRVEPLIPPKAFETWAPIPDLSWITIEPREIEVPAHGEGSTDIRIGVPDDEQWADRKFVFWVRSQSVKGTFGVALVTKFRFNTVRKPRGAEPENPAADAEPANE